MVDNAPLAVLILAGGAGAIYLSQSSFWSVTADIAGPHSGVVSGFMNMGCQIGGALTSTLTPMIAAQFGWTAAFIAGSAVVLARVLAWAVVDRNRLPEQPLGEGPRGPREIARAAGRDRVVQDVESMVDTGRFKQQ